MSRAVSSHLLVALVVVVGAVGCPAQPPLDRQALKEELRRELKDELRRELRSELSRELARLTGQQVPEGDVRAPASRPTETTPSPATTRAGTAPAAVAAGAGLPAPSGGQPVAGTPGSGPKVVRAVMARGVKDRVALDPGTEFSADGSRVYAYAEFDNRAGPETHVHFVWRLGERVYSQARLRIGRSPSWRTWSYHRVGARQAGEWTVEIRSEQGDLLHTLTFSAGS